MKKREYRWMLAAVCAAMAISVTACGGKTEETTKAETTVTETVEETRSVETTAEETTAQEEEQEMTGEIVAAGMSTITIRDEAGNEDSFVKEDTKIEMEGEQIEGAKVTVTYVERDGIKYAIVIADVE